LMEEKPNRVMQWINADDMARSIYRSVEDVARWLKLNVDTDVRITIEGKKGTVVSFRSTINPKKVDDIVEDFIVHFVICGACQLPETSFGFNDERDTVELKCAACGCTEALLEKCKNKKGTLTNYHKYLVTKYGGKDKQIALKNEERKRQKRMEKNQKCNNSNSNVDNSSVKQEES